MITDKYDGDDWQKWQIDTPWIGVDLDGTLAVRNCGWPKNFQNIGVPIPAMVERVKRWLGEGKDVRIFTARLDGWWMGSYMALHLIESPIRAWCLEHIGQELPITNIKDHNMIELWDDRARHVEQDTGVLLG